MIRSFDAAPFVTVTLTWPPATLKNVPPLYGASAVGGLGRGLGIAPTAAGSESPFVSAQSARSTPDSAIARAWALAIWFAAITGSVEVNARNATVSAVT